MSVCSWRASVSMRLGAGLRSPRPQDAISLRTHNRPILARTRASLRGPAAAARPPRARSIGPANPAASDPAPADPAPQARLPCPRVYYDDDFLTTTRRGRQRCPIMNAIDLYTNVVFSKQDLLRSSESYEGPTMDSGRTSRRSM